MPSSYKLRLRATPSGSTELSQDGATYLAVLRLVQDRTSLHNIVFLEGVKAVLTADAAWNHGWYDGQPAKGLRSMARVYAGWGFSQASSGISRAHTPELRFSGIIGRGAPEVKLAVV